ncbi:hypothetical protein Tco_0936989, partial [Tanacetum coccineum]
MSDSEDSTVTYTAVSSPFEDGSDIGSPGVDGPPIMPEDPYAYIMAAYQAEEMPKEDPADYPADRNDDDDEEEEDEPSRDDADDEDEDEDKDEEEHPASADSVPPVYRMTARISIRDEPSISLPPREEVERLLALTTPPPSPLTPLSSPLPQILSPPLPASPPVLLSSIDHRADRPEVCLPPRKRLCSTQGPRYEVGESSSAATARPTGGCREDYGFVDPREAVKEVAPMTLEGVNTRVTELAAVQEQDTQDIYAVIEETQDRQTQIYQRVETLVDDSQYHYETARLLDQEALVSREAWGRSIEVSYMARSEIMTLRSIVISQQAAISQFQAANRRSQTVTSEILQADHMRQAEIAALQTFDRTRQEQLVQTLALMQSLQGQVTTLQGQKMALKRKTRSTPKTTTTTTSVTNAQLQEMIDQGVTAALAARDATRNGDDSHTSGTGVRRTERVARECTYQDFMKCQPLY